MLGLLEAMVEKPPVIEKLLDHALEAKQESKDLEKKIFRQIGCPGIGNREYKH